MQNICNIKYALQYSLLNSNKAVLILNAAQMDLSAPSAKVRLCLFVCILFECVIQSESKRRLRLGGED